MKMIINFSEYLDLQFTLNDLKKVIVVRLRKQIGNEDFFIQGIIKKWVVRAFFHICNKLLKVESRCYIFLYS